MYKIKKTTKDMKKEYNKDMESHTQKESSRNPRNKKSLISTKKYS
jgi:hypothetical protein